MLDQFTLRFSRFFIRHRHVNLALIGAATLYFGYQALQLQVFSQFIDLLPRDHQFIEVYEKYNRRFGSANVVTAAIVARDGTIYNERFLEKVYGFTDQIDKIDGVDHGQIVSITHITVRDQEVDRSGILRSRQIVGQETIALLEAQFFTRRALARAASHNGGSAPATLDELREYVRARTKEIGPLTAGGRGVSPERLRAIRLENAELGFLGLRLAELSDSYTLLGEELRSGEGTLLTARLIDPLEDRIHQNKQVYGRLVSLDDRATLVTAGFIESRLDYSRIFQELRTLKAELEADGTVEVHLTGQPVLAGWTFAFLPEIVIILLLSLAVLIVLLGVYFRHYYGVVMPFSGAIVSAIWGLGFISLMGYQLEPLVLVIPMLITARAVSHSVQFVERFYEEYERLADKEEAVIQSMAELLLPGTLAIITDAFGIFVIGVSSIALMQKVAFFGAFWALSIAVTEMLLNRLMIAYFPAPKSTRHYTPAVITRLLSGLARVATGRRSARVVVGLWLLLAVTCLVFAGRVTVGESRPGTPILYEDSEYNRSAAVISERFFGADEFQVIVETELRGGVHRPEVMHEIESFQRYMEQDPKVGGSISIVDYLKAITRTFHNADPRWLAIPYTPQEIGGLLYLYEASAPDPRVLNPVRDQEAQNAAIRLFYADHQGDTIQHATERALDYIERRPRGKVNARLRVPEGGLLTRGYDLLGPLVPPRRAELEIFVRSDAGAYELQEVSRPDRVEPAPEDSSQRILTLPRVTRELRESLIEAGYDTVQKIADAGVEELGRVPGYDLATAYALIDAAELDRRDFTVPAEWQSDDGRVSIQVRKRALYDRDELWISYEGRDWERRESGRWAEGTSFALASGLMGVLAAGNDEVRLSNNAIHIASFSTVFLIVLIFYRSFAIALLMISSLATAALISLAYMYVARIGFDVNTLPVQALGVGVGVDYALYIMDRVVNERKRGHELIEALQIAIQTTGMAVFFTASTLVGGIVFWYFISSLRFAADMSLLLSILLVANMLGAMLLIPALVALFRPRFALAVAQSGVEPEQVG